MWLKLVNALGPPLTTGFSLINLLAPELRSSPWLYWSTIISAGVGLDSLIFFWFRRAFLTVDWLSAAGIALVFLLSKREESPASALKTQLGRFARCLLAFALIIALADFLAHSAGGPHGGWDGWAIWNLHARVL